jgi:hypothetical protein
VPAPEPEPKPELPPTERSIYIPYEDLEAVFEKDGRGVFLPYREFLDLWNQLSLKAEEEEIDPPTDGVLSSAHYSASLEGDENARVLKIVAKLQAESFLEKGWSVVPLIAGELNVAEAETGEATLHLADAGGYQLILPKKGKYEVTLTLYAKVRLNAGRNAVTLNLPKAGVSRFEAALPEQGWDFEIQPGAAYSTEKLPDGGTKLAFFFGGTERFDVSWQKQGEETKLTPLLFVESGLTAKMIPGALQTEVGLDYRILRAGVDRFEITVPAGQEVLAVNGENIREWDVQEDGTSQRLSVQLHSPAKQSYRLTVSLEEALDALPTELNVPQVVAAGVVRQRGTVNLLTSPELEVTVVSSEGLTQQSLAMVSVGNVYAAPVNGSPGTGGVIDVGGNFQGGSAGGNGGSVGIGNAGMIQSSGQIVAMQAGLNNFGRYRYLATPFAMVLSAKKAEPEVDVKSFTRFSVEPDEATFTTRFNYSVKRVGIFEAQIAVPDGFENIEASGAIVEDDSEETVDGKRILKVKFNGRRSGDFSFEVSGRKVRAAAIDDETVPVFEPLDVERHEGKLGVAVHTSLDPTTKEEGDLRQQDVSLLGPSGGGAGGTGNPDPFGGGPAQQADPAPQAVETIPGSGALTLGFRYRGEAAPASIGFALKEPQVNAEVLALVDVRENLVRYEWRIGYEILYAGVDRLIFSVPEEIAEELRADGEIIKEKDRDYQPDTDAGDPADLAAGAGRRLWAVTLRDQRMGSYELKVSYEQALAEATTRDFSVEMPELRLEALFQENGQVAVVKDDNLEVLNAEVANLEQIDPKELRGWLNREGVVYAYKYRRHPLDVKLSLSRNEFLAVPPAIITYAVSNTVVASDRAMSTEVIYWVKNNSKQFLSVALPEDGRMVSDVFVNGEAQQPMRRADENEVLIRLPSGTEGGTGNDAASDYGIPVRFVFENPSPEAGSKLGMFGGITVQPARATDAEVLQSLTNLYLPEDYRYRKFDSAMRLPVESRGWSRFRSAFDWLIPALGPQIDTGYGRPWDDPPALGSGAGGAGGGFDITIPKEGQVFQLHRLDAPDQIRVSFRSQGFAFFWEALFCVLALAAGLWLLRKPLLLRFVYFVGIGVLSLIIAGAVAPGAASFWRAIYLGVLLAALVWLAVGAFANLRALKDRITVKAAAVREKKAKEKKTEPAASPIKVDGKKPGKDSGEEKDSSES